MRNGWFSKITGCWGQFCQHSTKDEAHKWIHEAEQLMAWPPRVENDCGDYCAAFSWLHPELPFAPFSFNGYKSGIMLAFEATDEVWSQVQCMAVADAFTSTRACCSCDDPSIARSMASSTVASIPVGTAPLVRWVMRR